MSWKKIIFPLIVGSFIILLSILFFSEDNEITICFGSLLLFVGVAIIISAILKKLRTEYAITNKRLYCKYGLISRRINQADINKMTDTSFSQGLFDRILGIGTIYINTAGTNVPEIVFNGLNNPKYVISIVENVKHRNENLANVRQRVERIEDRYLTGEITKEQYDNALRRLQGHPDPESFMDRDIPPIQDSSPSHFETTPPPGPVNEPPPPENKCEIQGEIEGKSCPNCGKELDPDWLSCPYCGERVARRCPECNSAMPMPVYKCNECGYEETIECSNCGKEISKDLIINKGIKYCPECSSKLPIMGGE